MPPILSTTNLGKTYRSNNQSVDAVSEVSVNVGSGEFVALVGPSGSGKTTLLAMLATLLEASNGTIAVDGYAFDQMNAKQRARFRREKIGFTFQDNNLVPYLTAIQNVELKISPIPLLGFVCADDLYFFSVTSIFSGALRAPHSRCFPL